MKVINKYIKMKDYYILQIIKPLNSQTKIFEVKFDLEDFDLISKFKWNLTDDGYARSTLNKNNRKQYRMHRLIFPEYPLIDHKNRDKLDNRRNNLQNATYLINNKNKSKSKLNKSGRTGVYKRLKNGLEFWVAEWADNKKKKQKWFSVQKYGDQIAFDLASKIRLENEERLNILTEK